MRTIEITKPDKQRFLKALIYGPPGQGKTTLLGTAQSCEETSPMLLIDFEGGVSSLAGLDIDVARIHSWEDYNEVYDLLLNENHGYKSIGIDSISETHTFSLLSILKAEGPTRKDPELLEMRDYGKALVQMRRFLRAFRDLPLHVFYTALAKETTDAREGIVRVPALAGALAEEVPGIMDVVGYLALTEDEEGVERVLLLSNYSKYRTKVRTPWGAASPDEIESPTVASIIEALGFNNTNARRRQKA